MKMCEQLQWMWTTCKYPNNLNACEHYIKNVYDLNNSEQYENMWRIWMPENNMIICTWSERLWTSYSDLKRL